MKRIPIADLNPQLPDLGATQFEAIVTLLWPYSSSTRQCALLLAEPDFRLRRRRGQVKACFSGSCARAIAQTGVGIGDKVVLTLRGAQFVQEEVDAIQTPGRSIDWDLLFSQTLVVRISRAETEIASLELVDIAPTPADTSPDRQSTPITPRKIPALTPRTEQQWSSPAFLRRSVLHDGSPLGSSEDALLENEVEDGRDRKRRRKSYRDWNVWTYTARSPSPEESQVGTEDMDMELEPLPVHLPVTPISPSKLNQSVTADSPARSVGVSEVLETSGAAIKSKEASPSDSQIDEPVRQDNNDDLYAGPDGTPPLDLRPTHEGSTVENTESELEEEDAQRTRRGDIQFPSHSTVPDSEDEIHGQLKNAVNERSSVPEVPLANEVVEIGSSSDNDDTSVRESDQSGYAAPLLDLDEQVQDGLEVQHQPPPGPDPFALTITAMPPPSLAPLQTDFTAHAMPGSLTPIGREPSSPVIKPLDSSTLPMPSPFPGEREGNSSSFLDSTFSGQSLIEPISPAVPVGGQLDLPSHDSSISNSNFFDMISSANAPGFQSTHESAFTDLRFTFGLDGSLFSRPAATLDSQEQQPDADVNHNLDHSIDHTGDTPNQQMPWEVMDAFDQYTTEGQHVITDTASTRADVDMTDPALLELDLEQFAQRGLDNAVKPMDVGFSWGNIQSELKEHYVPPEPAVEAQQSFDGGHAAASQDPEVPSHDSKEHHTPTGPIVETHHSLDGNDAEGSPIPEIATNESRPHEKESVLSALRSSEGANVIDLGSGSDSSSDVEEAIEQDVQESTKEVSHDEGSQELVKLDEDEDSAASPSELVRTPSPEESASSREDDQVRDRVDESHHTNFAPVPRTDVQQSVDDEANKPEDDFTSAIPATSLPEPHTEIKLESIEEDVPLSSYHEAESHAQDEEDESSPTPTGELVIAVPEGKGMGEIHYKTVPATGPARSTRSMTKALQSPVKVGFEVSQHRQRGQSSKSSTSRDLRTTSPATTPKASAVSPVSSSAEQASESPYNLRSRQVPRAVSAASDASPKRTRRRLHLGASTSPSKDSFNSLYSPPSQSSRHPDLKDFQQSQELGEPRRYPTAALFVKDSEEGSLHSENSLSTNLRSDDVESAQLSDSESKAKIMGSLPGSPQGPAQPKTSTLSQMSPPRRRVTRESPPRLRSSRRNKTDLPPDPSISIEVHGSDSLEAEPRAATYPDLPLVSPRRSARLSSPFSAKKEQKAEREASQRQPPVKELEQSSPSVHSEDGSDSETDTQVAPAPELPSVGLSTPVSYYTALKDLSYFLNRSSQFETSSTPDVLALVTTGTTAPKHADKGPKHWHTTLHITDISRFPESTSVNVFRPHASALPIASEGDIILLRQFQVKSLNRKPMLLSGEESAWCVWRWSKPMWGAKGGPYGELRAREEMMGPHVEKGEGEWKEVEKLRAWWVNTVKHAHERGDAKAGKEDKVVGSQE